MQLSLCDRVDLRLEGHQGHIADRDDLRTDISRTPLLKFRILLGAHLHAALGGPAKGYCRRMDRRRGLTAGGIVNDGRYIGLHLSGQPLHDLQALGNAQIHLLRLAVGSHRLIQRLLLGHLVAGGGHNEHTGSSRGLLQTAAHQAGDIRGYLSRPLLHLGIVDGAGLEAVADEIGNGLSVRILQAQNGDGLIGGAIGIETDPPAGGGLHVPVHVDIAGTGSHAHDSLLQAVCGTLGRDLCGFLHRRQVRSGFLSCIRVGHAASGRRRLRSRPCGHMGCVGRGDRVGHVDPDVFCFRAGDLGDGLSALLQSVPGKAHQLKGRDGDTLAAVQKQNTGKGIVVDGAVEALHREHLQWEGYFRAPGTGFQFQCTHICNSS